MQVRNIFALFIYFFLSGSLSAQNIEMNFPAFAGKAYDFIIFQGDKQVKIQHDTIPANGRFTLVVPTQYAPYTGMCRWLITNTAEGGGLDMAVPGYGFSVSCMSSKPNSANISYNGYDAVNELNRLNQEQRVIINRFETITHAISLYESTHPLFSALQKEQRAQVLKYNKFQQDLKKNPNYNARILPIFNLNNGIAPQLSNNREDQARLVNLYITDKLNFDDLFTSGHWTSIIQSWVQLQAQVVGTKASFVKDFNSISRRFTDANRYTDFVGKVTYFLTKYGKDDFVEAITSTVVNSGKITAYEGATMQVYTKALVGSKAPDIVLPDGKVMKSGELATADYRKTLLVFFASDCGHCEELLKTLQVHYQSLQERHIHIVALAADADEEIFKRSKLAFPWEDTFCDFKGMLGVNFRSYAVLGTPTLVLINAKGIIELRTSKLDEVLINSKI